MKPRPWGADGARDPGPGRSSPPRRRASAWRARPGRRVTATRSATGSGITRRSPSATRGGRGAGGPPPPPRHYHVEQRPIHFLLDGVPHEIHYLRTSWRSDGRLTRDELTPYEFANGRLVAFGWSRITPPAIYEPPAGRVRQRGLRAHSPRSFDATWTALLEAVQDSYFEVRRYERASGLLELSFDSFAPWEALDCGRLRENYSTRSPLFEGPYLQYLVDEKSARLRGRLEIRLHPAGSGTDVTAVARYALDYVLAPSDAFRPSYDFRTGTRARIEPGDPGLEAGAVRTCQPTHAVERRLLHAVDASRLAAGLHP